MKDYTAMTYLELTAIPSKEVYWMDFEEYVKYLDAKHNAPRVDLYWRDGWKERGIARNIKDALEMYTRVVEWYDDVYNPGYNPKTMKMLKDWKNYYLDQLKYWQDKDTESAISA
jgi:hypothetical protein